MGSEIAFREHLAALGHEYERICDSNVALQRDNKFLRERLDEKDSANQLERLGESPSDGPDPRKIGKFLAMRNKKFEAPTPETCAGAPLDDDCSIDAISSVPSDIPREKDPDLVTEEVRLDEASDRSDAVADLDLAISSGTDLDEIHCEVYQSGAVYQSQTSYMSYNGYESERDHRGSCMSSQMSMRGFTDPSLHVPIFPKWFDPGFTNFEDFEAHASGASRASEFSLDEVWGPPKSDRGPCVLMPVGWMRLSWDFTAFLILLVDLWVTPFELFFITESEAPNSFTVIQHCITGFFCADILLNFTTGFIEEDRTVLDRRRIVQHYLRRWFWVDLLATVPFDLILMSVGTGMFSVARLGKASKVAKTLRYLKLVRAVRLVKLTAQANTFGQHFPTLAKVQKMSLPGQCQIFLILFAHVHCCLLALAKSEIDADETVEDALRRYFETFWWAYCAVTVGASLGPSGPANKPWVWLVEMILISERLLLLFFVSMHVIFKSLTFFDDARRSRARDQVLKYLRQHRVSFKTQIQVLYSLRDTGQAKKYQMYATELFANELPRELRSTICLELWSGRLEALGLIKEVANWHRDFIPELSLIVYEEVFPSRAILFKVGDAASAAYHILTGSVAVIQVVGSIIVPDFSRGMWVGESSLTSALLRRSATLMTKAITSVMVVPGAAFQGLISRFGLMERYQKFLSKMLWKGICGRCGMLGDHFTDSCGHGGGGGNVMNGARLPYRRSGSNLFFQGAASEGAVGELNFVRSSTMKDLNFGIQHFNLEMKRYFITHSVEFVMPMIRQELPNVSNLDGLMDGEMAILKQRLEADGWSLTKEQESALTEASINKYRDNNAERVARTLFREVSRLHHLIFLSHYKLEAGTEAALMRTELEQAIAKDPGSPGDYFDEPVFLDSDNLTNLEDIQSQVKRAHNLVLLLTRGVLLRPWVLIEIVTALREGLRIHLVNVAKVGAEFEFPTDDFYYQMENGQCLDDHSWDVIHSCDITIEEVTDAIKAVFKKIAVTYSPHKSTGIRQAEIGSLLRQCQLKDT